MAQALSEALQRIHPVKACFNVAQWMAAAAAGSWSSWPAAPDGRPADRRDLLALAVAMAVSWLVNDLALVGVLWLAGAQPLRRPGQAVRPLVVPVWLIGGGDQPGLRRAVRRRLPPGRR